MSRWLQWHLLLEGQRCQTCSWRIILRGGCSSGFILQAAATVRTCCASGTASREAQGTRPRGVTSCSPPSLVTG